MDNGHPCAPTSDLLQACLRHQRTLSRFGARALVEDDLSALLRQAAASAAEGLNFQRAKVLQYRARTDDFLVVAGVGWNENVVGRAVMANDPDTPPGRSLATRQPVPVADLRRAGTLNPNRLLAEHGVVSALNVPIVTDGTFWGVLEVDGSEPYDFHEMDVLFMQGFAHLLGTAIRRTEAQDSARFGRIQFDAVLTQLPVGVAIAEAPSGRLLLYNDKGIDLLGHPIRESATYEDYAQYGGLHPDGTPYRADEYPLARAVRHGETVEQEPLIYRRGDGRLIHLLLSAAPVRDADGAILLGVSVVQDIDERVRMEAELREARDHLARMLERTAESEARYRAAFEQAAVGIAETDQDGRVQRANDRFCAIVGYTRDELLTLRFHDITHPDDLPAGIALTERLYAGNLTSFTQEKRYMCKGGGTVWVSLTCSAVRDAAGRPAYVLAVVEDISARKQAEAEREDLLDQQELLMHEMNHRIKNSLQMVALLVHMQAMDIPDPAIRTRFEETAARIATVALVHRRLYQASGLEHVESAPYLRDLCNDIAAALGMDDGRLAVQAIDVVLPADTAIALGLMVNELVTNAAKYAYPAARPGPVRVTLDRTPEGRLRLAVADDGIGLPPDFDPAASPGLGMRVLVALAGKVEGELHADSGDGGLGTCFRVVMRG